MIANKRLNDFTTALTLRNVYQWIVPQHMVGFFINNTKSFGTWTVPNFEEMFAFNTMNDLLPNAS